MENTAKSKMYLAAAVSLAICGTMLILFHKAGLPVSGLVLFGIFYALSFAVKYTDKRKKNIKNIQKFLKIYYRYMCLYINDLRERV